MDGFSDKSSSRSWRVGVVVVLTILLAALAGCSGDSEPRANGFGSNGDNSNQQNSQDPDAGNDVNDANDEDPDANGDDPDANDDDPDANDDNSDVNDENDQNNQNDGNDDEPVELITGCGTVIDLGELDFSDSPFEIDVDFDGFDGDVSTDCDIDGGDVAIYRFQTPYLDTSTIDIDTGGLAAVEVGRGTCDGSDDFSYGCQIGDYHRPLQPGTTHHIIVEALSDDTSTLDLTLDLQEMPACFDDDGFSNDGESTCLDNSTAQMCDFIVASPDVPREFEFTCPTECSGERCEGDSCDNPITVSADEPFYWSGSTMGFLDHHNSKEEVLEAIDDDDKFASCLVEMDDDDGMEALDTPGRDIIFELQDLGGGDEISVEVDHDNTDDIAILIKRGCENVDPCIDVWSGQSEINFEIPTIPDDADDDLELGFPWYVIIDGHAQEYDGQYDISVEIN